MTGAPAGNEFQRVGEALNMLTVVLRPFVDDAMTAKYGIDWHERVAEERPKRRDGKPYPVSKDDLLVMLQAIAFREIEPWSKSAAYKQIRGYAHEIITVRNAWAHTQPVDGEHARLIDTINRLLGKLDLPIPEGLALESPAERPPLRLDGENARLVDALSRLLGSLDLPIPEGLTPEKLVEPEAAPTSTRSARPVEIGGAPDAVEEAVARFGEKVRRPAELFAEDVWPKLEWPPDEVGAGVAVLPPLLRLHATLAEADEILLAAGEDPTGWLVRALALLTKWETLGGAHPVRLETLEFALLEVRRVRALRTIVESLRLDDDDERREYIAGLEVNPFTPELLRGIDRGLDGTDDEMYEAFGQADSALEAVRASFEEARNDPTRLPLEAIRAAAGLPEGVTIVHQALFRANSALYFEEDEVGSRELALRHIREAVAQQRMLISLASAMDVRAERMLVGMLRLEGQLCNDLNRPNEAIRAFARVDEITDRYPMADPYLGFDALGEGH